MENQLSIPKLAGVELESRRNTNVKFIHSGQESYRFGPNKKLSKLVSGIVVIITLALLKVIWLSRVVHMDTTNQAMMITSSTYSPRHEAHYAIDGDPETFWQSEKGDGNALPQWIQLDLGDIYHINQVSCLPRQDHVDSRLMDYAILLSLDGVSFFTVTQGIWPTGSRDLQTALFPVTSARYVRLKALSVYSGSIASIAEMSVQNVSDLVPLLISTSSSAHTGYEASNALDNDPSTFWHSEWVGDYTLPQWIQLDLNDVYTIDQLSYLPRQDEKNGRIKDYAIQLSLDGLNFFTVTHGTWLNSASLQTTRFSATDACYIRLVAFSDYSSSAIASVAEISMQQTDITPTTAKWTARSSSHRSGYEPHRAIDNDILTFWQSDWKTQTASLPQWIELDLGEPYNINRLSYLPRQDSVDGRIRDYIILLSTDGDHYFTVTSGAWPTNTRRLQVATFTPMNVRYVRLIANSDHEGDISVAQIRVENIPGTSILKRSVKASSQTEYEAYNAIDNDPSTFWLSEGSSGSNILPQWIQLDLEGAYHIGQLSYLPRQDKRDGRMRDYAILLSVNGTDFFTVKNGTWLDSKNLQTTIFPATSARYIRLVALSNYGTYSMISAAEVSVQGARSVKDVFWGNRSPATATSFPNYQMITLPGSSYTRTYRIYAKPREYGTFNWSIWFGNQVDNEPVDGKMLGVGIGGVKTTRTNDPGGSWRVVSAYFADGGTSPDGSIDGEPIAVTFGGRTFKDVKPLERFWSDSVRLNVPDDHYLAFSWTIHFGAGKSVPFSLQHQNNCYWKEGQYANQSNSAGFELARGFLNYAVAPNLFAYEKDGGKRMSFLGDSITQGFWGGEDFWVSRIADGLGPNYRVWNLGSGFGHAYDVATNAAWYSKAILNDEIAICIGVNDIDQRRTSDQILADLASFIGQVKQRDPDIKVILFTITPYNFIGEKEQAWRTVNDLIRTDGVTTLGADYVFDAAGVFSQHPPNENLIVPEYATDPAAGDCHPNPEGAQVLADAFLDWYDTIVSPSEHHVMINDLYAVSMISTSFGYAVGESGTILRYENGRSWQSMSSPTAHTLYSVSEDGWFAVGEGGTILSQLEDYYVVPWYIETSPTTRTLYSVAMISTTHGIAVGEGGTILSRSKDQLWELETSPTTSTLYSVSTTDNDCSVAVGESGIIISRCHGQPWQLETSHTTKTLYSVAMASADFGKAVGEDGVILSRANGQSWQVETNPTTRTLYSVIIVQGDGYWAVGEGGTILCYSFDELNHDTWQIITSPTATPLYSLSGPRCCKWAVGGCGIILNNQGKTGTWQIQSISLCKALYLPFILRDWVVGISIP